MSRGTIDTIGRLLLERATSGGDRAALLTLDSRPVTYAVLAAQLMPVVEALRSLGVKRSDRVAAVLPDGLELAAAFLSVSACAGFSPLNPAYGTRDYEFYLDDLQARALILLAGQDSRARGVARGRGIPVIDLCPCLDWTTGIFTLESGSKGRMAQGSQSDLAEPDDVALVLHTSGTTSRPKMVPLTHRNLCGSARNVADTLKLTPEDRTLSIMPLFHIHGLIGVVLSSIMAGASVICTPGFDGSRFFEWLARLGPTWYSAVPTMHQAIEARAASCREPIRCSSLRFIRSSSSALPRATMERLEDIFGTPVIEAYGMTEASHQMASNPLPPGVRKAGSVGLAAGQEVAIMDEKGGLSRVGETGEIVIRGPNVFRGYENNPVATAKAFVNGWFRTGDQGRLDVEGYLFITGRLKEIINRGGEKIAPREIDEALELHPGVSQAVTFAIPHPTLGEEVAAAVVAKDGWILREAELREFAAQILPAFKVPSRLVVVKEIPKGSTGKIQRIGLAERLARDLSTSFEVPRQGLERMVASVMEQVLDRSPVGRHENFFAFGGDSIRATQVLVRLKESLGFEIPQPALFDHPTVAQLAAEVSRLQEAKIETLAGSLEGFPPNEAARILSSIEKFQP